MVPNITAILQRLTGEWAARLQPEAILSVCGEVGYTGWRDRVLTPVTTMPLFLLQILHGHTACRHLPPRSSLRFTAAAYCQARARLPLRCFDLLLERFNRCPRRRPRRPRQQLHAGDSGPLHRPADAHLPAAGGRTIRARPANPDFYGSAQ